MINCFSEGDAQALAPRYTWLCCIQVALLCLVIGVAAIVVDAVSTELDLHSVAGLLWLLAPILLLLLVFAAVSARAKRYSLSEHHMSFYSGVLFQQVAVQPFTRLQHIEITRGPLERALGLATLKLFSAGGAQHTLAIPGLPMADAEQLRGAILGSKGLTDEQ